MQYKMLNNKRIFSRVVPSASGCRMVGPLTHILTRIWAQGCPKLTCTLALPAADDQPWRRTRAQQRRPSPACSTATRARAGPPAPLPPAPWPGLPGRQRGWTSAGGRLGFELDPAACGGGADCWTDSARERLLRPDSRPACGRPAIEQAAFVPLSLLSSTFVRR